MAACPGVLLHGIPRKAFCNWRTNDAPLLSHTLNTFIIQFDSSGFISGTFASARCQLRSPTICLRTKVGQELLSGCLV